MPNYHFIAFKHADIYGIYTSAACMSEYRKQALTLYMYVHTI